MSANNSQIGYTPSEPLIINDENESNIDQLLSVDTGNANRPFLPLTTANIISNQTSLIADHPQFGNVLRPQHARRGARRQQQQHALPRQQEEQQHREQQQQRQQQEQEQQQQQQQQEQRRLRIQQANNRRYEQWLEHRRPREDQRRQYEERRPTTSNNRFHYHNSYVDRTDRMAYRLHLEDEAYMYTREEYQQQQVNELEELAAEEQLAFIQDEIEQMNQIDIFGKIEEQEQIQREQWEQEHLNEFQGLVVPELLTIIPDEIEQLNQIDTVAHMKEEEEQQQQQQQQQRNDEDLVQLEQWEHVVFLVQQLNQN